LIRAAQERATATAWHDQVRANGGMILSIDGREPDKGHATVYLVRAGLTGRLLAAENVRISDPPTITALLQPIRDLKLPGIGALSAAQESLLQAISGLWPAREPQIGQFHYLRAASRPMYELDRGLRTPIRKAIQQPVRAVRAQIERQVPKLDGADPASADTAAQLQVLDDYALAIQTALNLDGHQPFRYARLAVDAALSEIASNRERLSKGGAAGWSPPNSIASRS